MTPVVRLIVVEGLLEKVVARKLIAAAGLVNEAPEPIVLSSRFWAQVRNYDAAAAHVGGLVFGLKDLEQPGRGGAGVGVTCAPTLLARHLPSRHPSFHLRIAVAETEAWLLADAKAISRFLGVGEANVPADPERLPDAKLALVNLARKSRRKSLRDDIVPTPATRAIVGPGYTDAMSRYINDDWNPEAGSERSESLRRALAALRRARGA